MRPIQIGLIPVTISLTETRDDPPRPRAPKGPDGPPVRYQPLPLSTLVLHDDGRTSVARTWRAADVPRCRLCPRERCTTAPSEGHDGSKTLICLISVPRIV